MQIFKFIVDSLVTSLIVKSKIEYGNYCQMKGSCGVDGLEQLII